MKKSVQELEAELEEVRHQLYEANETIEAIRTGQVDALVVQSAKGHQLYTLKSADVAYRVFIEKMTEGAVTLNRDGTVLYCNSQFATMVNLPLSRVIGLPFKSFLTEENKASYQEIFKRCWTEDFKGEVALKAGDRTTPVQLSLTPLELEDGISLSMILTDLTAQKTAQQQLLQNFHELAEVNHALELSNNDLQQFASVASHDLQEPLRKIQMFSHLLKERGALQLTPDSKKYLEKIIHSAGRMKALIIDVLNYSKLSANDNPFEYVDLDELVKELLDDFELIIQEKKAIVKVGHLPSIDVNRGQMRQVFQNIISNALKFSKKGEAPIIYIDAKRISEKSFSAAEDPEGRFYLISIRDEGIGFDEKFVSNIFALFERLHSKDSYEGTGIGLAITKKIIEKHNGLVGAKSRPGLGSEFILILPINQ